MATIRRISTQAIDISRLAPIIGEDRIAEFNELAAHAREELAGTIVWNANSTDVGGGVAEMLRTLVSYSNGAGVDTRWMVVDGDPGFFDITKRLHNQVHGFPGSGQLGSDDAELYRTKTDARGAELAEQVRPGDVVLLHDPQTAGMSVRLAAAGAHLVWRCHIGSDHSNEWTNAAWDFLRPSLEHCDAFVFSRRQYAPDWLPPSAVAVIPPSIDPFSTKNKALSPAEVSAILQDAGILAQTADGADASSRTGSEPATIRHRAETLGGSAPIDPNRPLVVQVSRWDRLKDMAGVMKGFVEGVADQTDAQLALVGPSPTGVADDPEQVEVIEECLATWRALPRSTRQRVNIVTLPMDDVDENALMVNAVQRHAAVVVQKSLAEGFGLTVAEAMWKARPVVASAIGGIVDQIAPGTGVLLEDPTDLVAFAGAVTGLLADPGHAAKLGESAHQRVIDEFVGDRHLDAYARLMIRLCHP